MRLAIISDIHGNLPALEAVLADIRQSGVDRIICLGDIASIGPNPVACMDIVRDLNGVTLQGNHELYLLGQEVHKDWETCPSWAPVRWARDRLRKSDFDYMRTLPICYEWQENGRFPLTFYHASPRNQFLGFLPHLNNDEILERMNGLDHTILIVGHTHRQLYLPWSHSRIINTGAVGLPLDDPRAKYAIITLKKNRWHVELRAIEYNKQWLLDEFRRTRLPETNLVTAAYCYQMWIGQPIASNYLDKLRQFARQQQISVAEAYKLLPVPAEVRQWCEAYGFTAN